ncbi:zf-HC2 domain-containing protein [Micromonospora sp. M12]
MGAGGEHTTAEQSRLALYLLGALDEAERVSFEEHLAGCWRCLDEATEIGASTSGLAGLADVDWDLPADVEPLLTADPLPTADPCRPPSRWRPPTRCCPPTRWRLLRRGRAPIRRRRPCPGVREPGR